MDLRPPKDDDQANTEKAFNLIKEFIENHPEIEKTLWGGACISIFVDLLQGSGGGYGDLCDATDDIKKHYAHWFDEEEGK